MRTSTRISLAAAAIVAATISAPSAYYINGPKWASYQVPYYINPANADVTSSAAIAAIQTGASAWSSQSNANLQLYYMGTTSGSSLQYNSKNEVFFRSSSNGSTIGEAYWWADGSGRLIDADIVFYDGGFKFFTGTSGCSSGIFLEDVAAHEFGHAIGLGHSGDTTATMYSSTGWCSMNWRTLGSDDLAGVERLYPPGGTTTNTAPKVSIASPASSTSVAAGATITFSGSASDTEDGNISAKLVWTSSISGQLGTGASFSRSLTAGSHVITASAVDSKGLSGKSQVSVTVTSTTTTNTAPTVSISAPASGTSVPYGTSLAFSGSASDSQDGNISANLKWTSNLSGQIGTGASFTKSLPVGTHTISATVFDSAGASGTRQVTVAVTSVTSPTPTPSSFSLSAGGYKVKGFQKVNLKWSGTTATSIDVYRNGAKVFTTANDGAQTDAINKKGNGTYTYKVCAAGTTTCSNTATVMF